MPPSSSCLTTTHWISTPHGQLFAKQWQPTFLSTSSIPIILLHDSLGCVELWRSFPEQLALTSGHPVIAYDRLGFGQSDARGDRLSTRFVQEEAEQILPLLFQQFAIEYFVVLGHSVGGGMATYCAAHYPKQCLGLMTESAQAFVEDRTLAGIREAEISFQEPTQLDRLARYHGTKVHWVLEAWIKTWLSPEFADWSLAKVLPFVQCPTLVLHGEQDEYGSVAHPQMIAELIDAPTELEIMAGVKHVPHREQEQWVVERVSRFLKASL